MSGLVAFTGPPDRALLDRMLGRISHRGTMVGEPIESRFASSAVCDYSSPVNIGSVRTGRHVIGETSWHVAGWFNSDLPAEPRSDLLSQAGGSFSLANSDDTRLLIVRDPCGCQGLYYGRVGDRWLVASEPKAITMEAGFNRTIRPAAVAQYLSFSFVPSDGTMFGDLFEVQPGHAVRLAGGIDPVVERYFRFEEEECPVATARNLTADDRRNWIGQTRQTIEQAVAERLTDDPQAVFLSGGLDSSIVAAEVARQSPHQVQTFAIHFGKKYPNELPYARMVADQIGSQHTEVLIEPKSFLKRMREMVWHLDEPIGDPITQPNFELARLIGGRFPAVFNGEGGDPLFGGPKNFSMLLTHWYGGQSREPNFRERAYLASYRRAFTQWQELLHPELLEKIDPARDLENVLTPFFSSAAPAHFLNKLMAINIRLKGGNLILPKVDRMLAAHGVVPLSPLFDERLTRLSFAMPPTLKLDRGVEKVALKEAYADMLPREIIERRKSGMRVPVHYWFRKEMKTHARRMLLSRKLRAAKIFNRAEIARMLKYENDGGAGRFGLRLWMLLTFELWRQSFVEGR